MKLRTALMGAAATVALTGPALAERGSDGNLNLLFWQAVSTLNPYLSQGTKDVTAASIVLEPLARYDQDGNMVPVLATEIPTLDNGGVSQDLTSITWKLNPDIKWSDGTPFTANDVVFSWQYCTAEGTGCAQAANFEGVTNVEAVDDHTVKITFGAATPFPYQPFVGQQSPVLQQAQFKDCAGPNAATCTDANSMPVGTGPFRVTQFVPNDVVTFEANPNYREADKPAFATVTLKGGGDATGAARAVFETGETDYAWNLQVAPDVLQPMIDQGKGNLLVAFGTNVERIETNLTDPSPSLPEGERSTVAHPHPILSDPKVREALSIAIDRQTLVDVGYGDAGTPTCNLVPAPALYASDNTACLQYDPERAKSLLEEAGWTDTDGDGIRDKDGKPLSLLFQTSTNPVRQDFQALIKDYWSEIGVATELRNIDAAVFFGGDAGSPDTIEKFYADVEMYANEFPGTDPQAYLANYTCDKIPSPETQWQGQNINRYCDQAYEELLAKLTQTGDPEERGSIAKQLNDMLTKDSNVIIPLLLRGRVSGASSSLDGVVMNAWDSELWNIEDWTRKAG